MQQTNHIDPFYGPEDIKRYLSGSMTTQEMHDMEKAALKDPFLADAIDGFRNANSVLTEKHLNAIKAAIIGSPEQKVVMTAPPSAPKTQWWRWAVAACSLGIIASSIWWFTQKSNPDVAPLAEANTQPITSVEETAVPNTVDTIANAIKEPALPLPQQKPPQVALKSDKQLMQHDIKSNKKTENALSPSFEEATVLAKAEEQSIVPPASASKQLRTTTFNLPTAAAPQNNETFLATTKKNSDLPSFDSNSTMEFLPKENTETVKTYSPSQKLNKVAAIRTSQAQDMAVLNYKDSRKKPSPTLKDAQKAQAAAASVNEVIYPEEGWTHFYEALSSNLGVNASKSTQTLQIKFTVDDNGDPVDFEVVESPNAVLAKKAIEFIKKAKWKNFKLDKNALVKIEVN